MTRRKVVKPNPEREKYRLAFVSGYMAGANDYSQGLRNPTIGTGDLDETAPRVPIEPKAQVSGFSNQNFAFQNAFIQIIQNVPIENRAQMIQAFLQLTPEQQAIFIQQNWR